MNSLSSGWLNPFIHCRFNEKRIRSFTIESVALLCRMKECLELELSTCTDVESEEFHQNHYLKRPRGQSHLVVAVKS